MNVLSVEKLEDELYRFEEVSDNCVDAYFIVGEKRALMIDALQSVEGLYQKAREITPLPIDVVIAHGHGDHCGPGIREFKEAGCGIYMDRRDEPVLAEMGRGPFPKDFFTELKGIRQFDLGLTILDVIPLSGHTPGSVMLLDRQRRRLFSSDSIGSGPIWMQLSHSLPLHVFRDNLKPVYEDLQKYRDLVIFCGHRKQSPNPLSLEYLGDVLETAELILSNKETGESQSIHYGNLPMNFLSLKHKSMLGFCYDPAKL
ncbi:MBL fold metallo-hydrolase [Spirochaetia bacterium]|nr:MBL fold metallo-hydrolase [Spirochaetia bacterium]